MKMLPHVRSMMYYYDVNSGSELQEIVCRTYVRCPLPPKTKLESVPILVAIFNIWNSNVFTCSIHSIQSTNFQSLVNFLLLKTSMQLVYFFSSKQFHDLLKNLGLGNLGKRGFIRVFSEQAQIQSIFIHFIFQSLVKVSSCTFDIIG